MPLTLPCFCGRVIHRKLVNYTRLAKPMIIFVLFPSVRTTKLPSVIPWGRLRFLILWRGRRLRSFKGIQVEWVVCRGLQVYWRADQEMELLRHGICGMGLLRSTKPTVSKFVDWSGVHKVIISPQVVMITN